MGNEKRITWKKEPLKTGITAFNDKGEELGWLQRERVGAHMHWCWYQNEDIRMSPGCLQEVRDKQKQLSRCKHENMENYIGFPERKEGTVTGRCKDCGWEKKTGKSIFG